MGQKMTQRAISKGCYISESAISARDNSNTQASTRKMVLLDVGIALLPELTIRTV